MDDAGRAQIRRPSGSIIRAFLLITQTPQDLTTRSFPRCRIPHTLRHREGIGNGEYRALEGARKAQQPISLAQ